MSNTAKRTDIHTESSVSKISKETQSTITKRQTALAINYQHNPKQALVTDIACTSSSSKTALDPLRTKVTTGGIDIPIGVHKAVGGDGGVTIPGELLSAALASCLDSSIRMIADRLDIKLLSLAVAVSAETDVRGALKLNPNVPVEFQKMHVSVDLKSDPSTKPAMLNALLQAAESSCVVLQTLRKPPIVTTQFNLQCESL
jgi:uncharacterized OsmC-like protein